MNIEILYQHESGTLVFIRDGQLFAKAAASNGTFMERPAFADYEGAPAKPVYFWIGAHSHWVGINPGLKKVDNNACLRMLLTSLRNDEPVYVPKVVLEKTLHQEAQQLVYDWAMATGHTGQQHAQARQSRIRKVMKNGLDSDYARKLMREARIRD